MIAKYLINGVIFEVYYQPELSRSYILKINLFGEKSDIDFDNINTLRYYILGYAEIKV